MVRCMLALLICSTFIVFLASVDRSVARSTCIYAYSLRAACAAFAFSAPGAAFQYKPLHIISLLASVLGFLEFSVIFRD